VTMPNPDPSTGDPRSEAAAFDPLEGSGLEVTITVPTPEAYSTIGSLARDDAGLPGRVAQLVQAASDMAPSAGGDRPLSLDQIREFVVRHEGGSAAR
jgi:hypothetical protein